MWVAVVFFAALALILFWRNRLLASGLMESVVRLGQAEGLAEQASSLLASLEHVAAADSDIIWLASPTRKSC